MGVGEHIREDVIPSGMTVTEAARRLGVSRVALSNVLNGRASLSTAMQLRLERTFGADPRRLREAQEEREDERRRDEESAVGVRAYAPELVSVKARQISGWAHENVAARGELPVLIRRLVHSTGHGVRIADFPGYDNAERDGWDGRIEADQSTAWIPAGKSGWEFGTSMDVRKKAQADYRSRLRTVGLEERSEWTFVFVTPRNWPRKRQWVDGKRGDGWRDVRVLDADDLEQWLEESLTGQAWMAPRVGIPIHGVRTLDACWERWTSRTQSPMTPSMFQPLISMYAGRMEEWLTGSDSVTLVVSAESVDEALAFLACVSFTDGGRRLGEAAIVFDTTDALRRLTRATSKMTVVVCDSDLERELASSGGGHRAIVVRPRNIVATEADISLPVLTHKQFRSGLVAMGIKDRNEMGRLVRESGRSLTVLRRRLSDLETLPAWARDASLTEELAPMALVGVWDTASPADREALEKVSGRPYTEVEETVSRALKADDRPMWAAGRHRGVVSRIELLFAVAPGITSGRLQAFFDVAAEILGEEDPALKLDEDRRWMAAVLGHVRKHSAELREAVAETLVLLSTYAKHLLPQLPDIDLESRVAALVDDLLTPMSTDLALSHEGDLARYAEAAPRVYLNAVEADLGQPEPALTGLLQPTGRAPFLRFPRTGLLSGLECLAWNRQHLVPVVDLLAVLSKTDIDDNCMNTPLNSLLSIFRFCMPQTSASLDTRVAVLQRLCEREPEIGWRVCMDQLDASPRLVASGSYRPRWRDYATGHGEPVPDEEALEFWNQAFEIVLGWQHDAATLADLTANLPGMNESEQFEVWELIETWSTGADATEEARQGLGESIRGTVLTHRGARTLAPASRKRGREVYKKLVPEDSVGRVAWLFKSGWVEETVDGADAQEDGASRLGRMENLRCDAMGDLWKRMGFDALDQLFAVGGAPALIGRHLATQIDDPAKVRDVVMYALGRSDEESIAAMVTGLFGHLDSAVLREALPHLVGEGSRETAVRLLLCAPIRSETWRIMDGLDAAVQDQYWCQVEALHKWHLTSADWHELIDRLLAAGRPVAAMDAADGQWEDIETSRLKRILEAIGTRASEAPRELVDPHVLSEGMASLSKRQGVTEDELAVLELRLVTALEHSEYGIPNLEKQVSETPEMFVQLLAMAYPRDDEQVDESEEADSTPLVAAHVAYTILRRMRRIPGEGEQGVDAAKLQQWVVKARSLSAGCGRAETGEHEIGKLLAGAAGDLEQETWPARAICQVMEATRSDTIGHGFVAAIWNARGATLRAVDEGGRQERGLAAVYGAHAEALLVEFPFVSRVLRWLEESFESEAKRVDERTEVGQRLG